VFSIILRLSFFLSLTSIVSSSQAAAPAAPMDVDGPESGTQNIFEANDYGVEVDFDELDEAEQEVSFTFGRLSSPR